MKRKRTRRTAQRCTAEEGKTRSALHLELARQVAEKFNRKRGVKPWRPGGPGRPLRLLPIFDDAERPTLQYPSPYSITDNSRYILGRFGRIERSMKNHERWMELCELASKEQDPNKLMALVTEITRLLEEKRNRLNPKPFEGPAPEDSLP